MNYLCLILDRQMEEAFRRAEQEGVWPADGTLPREAFVNIRKNRRPATPDGGFWRWKGRW